MKYFLSITLFSILFFYSFLPEDSQKGLSKTVENEPELAIKVDPTLPEVLYEFQGVKVFANGQMNNVHGRNLAHDGYNLGLKWQCVEFVKRFYYKRFNHKMPDSYGHAKDFFDKNVMNGWNKSRALNQFSNRDIYKPGIGSILVFDADESNPFGHVAIISVVEQREIEVVQQNWGRMTRMRLPLRKIGNRYSIDHAEVLGWLKF